VKAGLALQSLGWQKKLGRKAVAGAVFACALVLPAGCAGNPHMRIGSDVALPARSVVILWADGVDHPRFDELAAAGRLPNIHRVFIEGGVGVEYAMDSLPSVTYANGASLLTGRFPGHCGIAGNLWLDRRTLQSAYYLTLSSYLDANNHLIGPTIYDLLSDHFTLNIRCHTRRGVSRSIDHGFSFAWHWLWNTYAASDAELAGQFALTADVAGEVKRWPSVVMLYCSGIDEIGHLFGPDSPEYAHVLETLDANVGQIAAMIDQAGLTDRTYFLLVTDHGMPPTPADRSVDLRRWLRERRGLTLRDTVLAGESYTQRLAELDEYDAFVAIGSDRHAVIHLRGEQGWLRTPFPDEVEDFIHAEPSLLRLPAVDCAVMRDGPDLVKVLSARGTAVVEREVTARQKRYRMIVLDGDPIGYEQDPEMASFVAAGWHTSREWLVATCRTNHPDFVPQVVEMLDSPRAGDVVLFAADEAAFSKSMRGGHGSCVLRDMRVIQFYAGPDLPSGTSIATSRLVDVAPTVLGLLGESQRLEDAPSIDGIDLTPQLKSAQPFSAQGHKPPSPAGNQKSSE